MNRCELNTHGHVLFLATFTQLDAKCCYSLFLEFSKFTDLSVNKLCTLGSLVGTAGDLPTTTVKDELAVLRMTHSSSSVATLYQSGSLRESPALRCVFERTTLICPQNMAVESGFSNMKYAENPYRSNLDCRTYDNSRLVCSAVDRDTFETFIPCDKLLGAMKDAYSKYRIEVETKSEKRKIQEAEAHILRNDVGVYKTSSKMSQISEANKEIEVMEKALAEARQKKARLEGDMDSISNNVMNNIFSK